MQGNDSFGAFAFYNQFKETSLGAREEARDSSGAEIEETEVTQLK